jgi:KaiC/GvpD/RAD55 family RecA-like ATPase
MAQCPAHDDRTASLAVADGSDGRVLLTCHAGCDLGAVLSALGLGMDALFAEGSRPSAPEPVATYAYRDEANRLLYEVVRYAPKDFRQRRPDGAGGWVWNLRDTRRVLYRLPELRGEREVVVVEGEKDVDRLWSVGIAATTSAGGASKGWTPDYVAQLETMGVTSLVIVPDADAPGRAYAEKVAAIWAPRPSRIVTLPDVPDKGDVSDFLATRSVEALRAVLAAPSVPVGWLDAAAQLAAIEAEDTEAAVGRRVYLGLPRIDETLGGVRRGEVCGVLGRPGIGKTVLLTHITEGVAEAGMWHVFVSLEMPAAQIVARLQQRLFGLGRHQREEAARGQRLDADRYQRVFERLLVIDTPGLSVAQIGERITQIMAGPCAGAPLGLVTIDHLGLIGGDRKLTTYDRVSVQAREIKELAKRWSCAVLLAVQVNRDAGGDGSRELGLGSARDSGVVEEAMDYMIGLRRLDRSLTLSARDREQYRDVIFGKVIKNRHGDIDTRETAYRFSPVGLRLVEDPRLVAEETDLARIASSGGRR